MPHDSCSQFPRHPVHTFIIISQHLSDCQVNALSPLLCCDFLKGRERLGLTRHLQCQAEDLAGSSRVVKTPPASAADGDVGSIPGQENPPGVGTGNPLQYSGLKNPRTEEPGRLRFMGLQRVRHDWVTEHAQIPSTYKNGEVHNFETVK